MDYDLAVLKAANTLNKAIAEAYDNGFLVELDVSNIAYADDAVPIVLSAVGAFEIKNKGAA